MTFQDLPSITATHELVVPRSMPMILLMTSQVPLLADIEEAGLTGSTGVGAHMGSLRRAASGHFTRT
jgi:hypothetical protein